MQKENTTIIATDLRKLFHAHGLRHTPQREAIYRQIIRSKEHPTADEIYRVVVKTIPGVSFDTVNRAVLLFAELGLLRVVEGSGEARRYDPDTEAHHHFRCIRCNRIVDFHNRNFDELKIPAAISRCYKVLNKRVVIEGLCDRCNEKK